jgi:hypothetical protein
MVIDGKWKKLAALGVTGTMANPGKKATYDFATLGVCLMEDSIWMIGGETAQAENTMRRAAC